MGKEKAWIVAGDLRLDKVRFEVTWRGARVCLTAKEFWLLWTMASKAGKVFRRAELLSKVWGPGLVVELRTIDAHIKTLRKKLRAGPDDPSCIETVWGVGYRLNSAPGREG